MADRFDIQLDRLWDDLVTGGPIDATHDGAQLLDAIHTLHAANPPGSARERARQRIFDLDSISGEDVMPVTAAALPLPQVNGRSSPARAKPAPIPRPATISTRWRWISIAAALLILLTSFGGWFAYERISDNNGPPAVIPAVQATPTDWPMYRGNPARTGAEDGFGPFSQPRELWRYQAGGAATRSPAIVGDVAYVASADGVLAALDIETGAERWRFTGDSSLEGTPTVAGGIAYITSQFGTLVCRRCRHRHRAVVL